jgi:hypothetical protein
VNRVRLLDDVAAEEVLARGVDNVQNQGERGDQHEIAVRANQLEAPLFAEWLVSDRRLCLRFRPTCDAIDQRRQERADNEDAARTDEQPSGSARPHQITGAHRANPCAEAAADADQGKQALALFLRVKIVGEGPELSYHHQVEDADPEEVRDAHVQTRLHGEYEQAEVRCEEQCHPSHQPDAIHARREGAVRRNEAQQQNRLARRRITLHLRTALAEDEHFASGLQEIVRSQEQKHLQRHE